MLVTPADARELLIRAWPEIVAETRAVLGGELHYQAVIYHCLRLSGAPRAQIGMNVKQWIGSPLTPLFIERDLRKHPAYRGGFEPIPDIVLFSPQIHGDWRRRNHQASLQNMLLAIEVKASERAGSRLSEREIAEDLKKLASHRDEAHARGTNFCPVMAVVDVAPDEQERMIEDAVAACRRIANELRVGWLYVSQASEDFAIDCCQRLTP
jgi:hypothetical protein